MEKPVEQPSVGVSSPAAERILATARQILLTEGSPAISMRRVAEGAGLTTMAPYRHFANRHELLEELARREFAAVAADTDTHWDGDPATVDQPLAAHLDLALELPHLYAFLFTERRDGARAYPDQMRAGLSPTLNVLVEGLCRGRSSGRLRFDDEWEVALIIAAELHGLIQLFHSGRISLDQAAFRRLCERAIGVILDGLRP